MKILVSIVGLALLCACGDKAPVDPQKYDSECSKARQAEVDGMRVADDSKYEGLKKAAESRCNAPSTIINAQ